MSADLGAEDRGKCQHSDSGVTNSRLDENGFVRRRRQCKRCDYRWTTFEVPAEFLGKVEALQAMIRAMSAVLDIYMPKDRSDISKLVGETL